MPHRDSGFGSPPPTGQRAFRLAPVLPADIRERLWPFLEYEPASRRPTRPRDDIVADLLRSNASIMLNLTR